jgi:hypothetical protein
MVKEHTRANERFTGGTTVSRITSAALVGCPPSHGHASNPRHGEASENSIGMDEEDHKRHSSPSLLQMEMGPDTGGRTAPQG